MRTGLLRDERLLVALREVDLVAAGLLAVVMDAGRLLAAPVEVNEGGHADPHEGEGHGYKRQCECGNDDGYGPHAQRVPAREQRKRGPTRPRGRSGSSRP